MPEKGNSKMSTNDIDRWMKLSEWRGEVTATLQGIRNELVSVKKSIQGLRESVTVVRLKQATLAASVSIICTVVVLIIANFIRK